MKKIWRRLSFSSEYNPLRKHPSNESLNSLTPRGRDRSASPLATVQEEDSHYFSTPVEKIESVMMTTSTRSKRLVEEDQKKKWEDEAQELRLRYTALFLPYAAEVYANYPVILEFVTKYEVSTSSRGQGPHDAPCKSFKDMFATIKRHELVDETVILAALVLMARCVVTSSNPAESKRVKSCDAPNSLFFHDMPASTRIYVTRENIRMFFVACLLLANKYMEDKPYDNYTYASLGQCSLPSLNQWELMVLKCISFDLVVDKAEIDELLQSLKSGESFI